MPTIDATVFPDEAYVLIEVDWSGAIYRNTFQVPSAAGWPAADTGQLHTIVVGAPGDFTVVAGRGLVTHAAVNTSFFITADVNMLDVSFSGEVASANIPAGNTMELSFAVRYVDNNNFIDARIFLVPGGPFTLNIRERIAGVDTVSGFPAAPLLPLSGIYGFRLEAIGPDVRFRVWDATGPEPLTWNLTFTTTWLTAGDIGLGSVVPLGVTTPVPIIFSYDNLVAIDPGAVTSDCAIVTRRNTVTGEIVTLRPYIFFNADGALMLECGQGLWWDTEPPLNVPLEYCTTACPGTTALSANSGFEGGITVPWVATGGVLTSSTTFAHEGTSSGLLTPTGGVSNSSFAQSFTGVLAGIPLSFSAWVMSPQGYNGVILRMSLLYTTGLTEVFETPVEILDDGEWRFLTSTVIPDFDATATFSFITMGAPPNTTLFYVDQIMATQPVDISATACETVTVESESVWLKSPLHPCLDIEIGLCNPMLEDCEQDSRVSYAPHSGHSYAPNTVVLAPTNRRRPIPVNRPRRDASATLRLIAHDCDAKDAVLAINAPGDPLLFQAPAAYCIPDRYITVGIEDEDYLSVDQREEFRLMTLPYETVDRPPGPADGICGARITDLCDIYTSWGALMIAGFTWTDLLLGLASPNGPGQPDPPAAARTWDDVEAEFTDWDDVEAGGTRDWDELRDGL